MPYYDVSIPLKLKRLTYYYEKDEDLVGYGVTVPLKNNFYDGLVLAKGYEKPKEVENIREIKQIWGRVYSKEFMDFLSWMSFYYVAEIGSILRLTFFDIIISFLKGKKKKKKAKIELPKPEEFDLLKNILVNEKTTEKIIEAMEKGEYKGFLIHCPTFIYEIKLMIEMATKVLSQHKQVLLILPEIKDVNFLFQILREKFGDAVVRLHSQIKNFELYESIEKILEDRAKIIIGTRFAIFAPAKNLSLLLISQESSWLYKGEETPRYNARDGAVMRGFIESCPVLLCDTMPSVNSYWNALRGKYELIDDFNRMPHPEIRILRQPSWQVFHPEVLLHLKLYNKEGILAIAPRAGFSLLRCSECGEVLKCEKCGYGMIYHKNMDILECAKCDIKLQIPNICPNCGGIEIHPIGTGVERLREELGNIFSSKKSLLRNYNFYSKDLEGILILQASKTKKTYIPQFKLALLVDFDFFLSIPDYRAMENAFGKVMFLSHMIKSEGIIFIQTRNPDNAFFKYLRSYDFKGFYNHELSYRKETLFPPFARLIKLTFNIKKDSWKELSIRLRDFLKSNSTADVMGPFNDQKKKQIFFILRSKDRGKLTEEVHFLIRCLKNMKGFSVGVEVDPVNLRT